MTSADTFVDDLLARVGPDPDVIGLVLAGSSAETERRDQWSDHDFLLITADGTPERYRTELGWLPYWDLIGFWFRETEHGLKVLYRDGLMLELAVFDRAEFDACALNHYAVALDKGGIADAATRIRARTGGAPAVVDRLAEVRCFLALLYIGAGRARRGETLSAGIMIRTHATGHLLRVLHDLTPPERAGPLDALDPWRRVETTDPVTAGAIEGALELPPEDAARALLDVADSTLVDRWPDYPSDDARLIQTLLGW